MKRITQTSALAAVATLGLTAALSAATPSVAAGRSGAKPSPTPSPTSTVPPLPDAVGCYSIVNGNPGYQRILSEVTQSEVVPGSGLYNKAVVVLSNRGIVYGSIELDAPSCVDVTYVLEVFGSTPSADGSFPLLGRTEQKGDGARTALALDTAFRGYTGDSVRVEARTVDAFGREVDTGSEGTPVILTALADGKQPGGGGNVTWR